MSDNTNYGWFLPSLQATDPYSLPHDHHELIAMIAPRAVIALGNPDYDFLGDESGYKSVMVAKEVWRALGVEDHVGFDFSGDHQHCSAAPSQASGTAAFVNRFLKGQAAGAAVVVKPSRAGWDYEYQNTIDWGTPTLH